MAAVDAGANVGLFTMLMAHRVGPTGKVLAFEPDSGNFDSLVENLHRNRVGYVDARRQALGSTRGVGRLDPSAANAGDHRVRAAASAARGQVSVDIVTLDSAWPADQPLDLIKMDIQGGEAEALVGMERTWAAQERLMMLLEFWPQGLRVSGSDPAQFLRELKEKSRLLRTLEPDGSPGPAVDSLDQLLDTVGARAAIPLLAGPRAAGAVNREVPKV
jgi:FkbM family methyltransferase